MDVSVLAPETQEVLNDLLVERGLSEWQVVRDVRISNEAIDVIYGYAMTASLQEERIDRKRKRKATSDKEQPTWSCFLVLPAVSSIHSSPTLSIKQLLSLQQCANTNEPREDAKPTRQTFLCLVDAANISYYALQTPF